MISNRHAGLIGQALLHNICRVKGITNLAIGSPRGHLKRTSLLPTFRQISWQKCSCMAFMLVNSTGDELCPSPVMTFCPSLTFCPLPDLPCASSLPFALSLSFALCTAQVLQEPGVCSRQLRTRAKAVKKLGTIFSQVNRPRSSPVVNIMEEFSEVLQASQSCQNLSSQM